MWKASFVQSTTRNRSFILPTISSLRGPSYFKIRQSALTLLLWRKKPLSYSDISNRIGFHHVETPDTPNLRQCWSLMHLFHLQREKLDFLATAYVLFILRPRPCFKCQHFGHSRKYCRRPRDNYNFRWGISHPLCECSALHQMWETP